MKKIVGLLVICFLFFSFLFALQSSVYASELVIQMGHVDPPDPFTSSDQSFAVTFKNLAESLSGGRIRVELYPANALGAERECMELLQQGIIESYIATDGGLAPFFPLLGAIDIPFAMTDFEVAYEIFDGDFGEEFAQAVRERTGLELLAIMEQGGFFHITNNVRPIKTPEDMRGIQFRTMTIDSHINFFESFGAGAVPISWAEVYTSLQTGVADGQHNPVNPIRNASLYEVQKYLTITNHLYSTHWFLVNGAWFDGLPEEDQQLITKAARLANKASRGLNRVLESSEDFGIPYLASKLETYFPTESELAAFAEVAVPAALAFVENDLGEEGLYWAKRYLEEIEKATETLRARGSYWK